MSERRLGVLIASSQYQDQKLQNLSCPESDVDGLNEVLSSKEHGNFAETLVLKNKTHDEVLKNIYQVLRQKAKKDDLVLIYYSGHGKLNSIGKLHLTTTDTSIDLLEPTSIPVDTIKSYIDSSPANKFIIILDSCFSGAAGDSFTNIKGGLDDQLQLASGGRGTYIMTASTGIQVAQEKEGDKYGVFTKHIIEGIKSGEAANDDGLVTMDCLYSYVHDEVLKEGSQEPMKWDLNVKGDLVIAGGGRSKRDERAKQIRAMLLDLANKNLLPDYVLSSSLRIIKLKPQMLTGEDRQHDELLDKLLRKELELNSFIEEWVNFAKESQPAEPKKKEIPIKIDKDITTPISFGEFFSQKRFKAMIAVYTTGLWITFLNAATSSYYWSPPQWLQIIIFGNLPLGLIIAIVSYRARIRPGFFLGILYPLTLIAFFVYAITNPGSSNQPMIAWIWLFPTAILTTILLWLTWRAKSQSVSMIGSMITHRFNFFKK
jgi:hypothetical protein